MVNFDQAEGLRRMLFGSKPRFVTFLSALTGEEKNATLVNLGAGLANLGNDVVILDARYTGTSVARWMEKQMLTTLVDVAEQKQTLGQAIIPTSTGIKLTSLCRYQNTTISFQPNYTLLTKLNKVVERLGNSVDIVLVDGELTDTNGLMSEVLEEGEVVIQLTNQPSSIKTAYGLIKRASQHFGRRDFGLLVTGVNEFEARRVYDAMVKAASNFLSVPVHFVGYVPQDDFLRRASRSGRSVIEVFPGAGASMAFDRLAQHMTGRTDFATLV